ncbi:unnamed protein product [Paramecium octaurelia]|uniref:Uncharacterized protein n=1 Tax=Paramecium octaurelia TaxID=43137 RepID=A0A8S1SZH7_PAROT|nr:unnamed protein product [Paramecium octaurelia]CAD8144656.1 unnamed protein product [Paramecium octaurelia]
MLIKNLFNHFKHRFSQYIGQMDGLFVFYGGNKLIQNSSTKQLKELYLQGKDNDGWLYLQVRIQENLG